MIKFLELIFTEFFRQLEKTFSVFFEEDGLISKEALEMMETEEGRKELEKLIEENKERLCKNRLKL